MSLSHSPQIITNGLVFAYDMANTQKSWKGMPTTNLIPNPTNEVIATSNEFAIFADLSPIFDTYGEGYYSISADIKSAVPGDITVYTASGSVEYNIGYYTASCETFYKRFFFNNINVTRTDPTASISNLSFYGGYGSGKKPSIKNVQVEKQPFCTPFVSGTRSNTQAIVDLVGQNTVTANGLTYNSDGTISFLNNSGFSIPSINFADAQTIEIWLKPLEADGNRRNPYNQAYAGYGTWTHEPNGTINYYYGDGGGDNSPYVGHTSSFTVAQNEIACVCTTRDLTTSWWYKNGVQYNSYPHSYGSLTATPGNITIGNGYAGAYYGDIYAVKLYNRALSAAEVKQNFNALRGRFGI